MPRAVPATPPESRGPIALRGSRQASRAQDVAVVATSDSSLSSTTPPRSGGSSRIWASSSSRHHSRGGGFVHDRSTVNRHHPIDCESAIDRSVLALSDEIKGRRNKAPRLPRTHRTHEGNYAGQALRVGYHSRSLPTNQRQFQDVATTIETLVATKPEDVVVGDQSALLGHTGFFGAPYKAVRGLDKATGTYR